MWCHTRRLRVHRLRVRRVLPSNLRPFLSACSLLCVAVAEMARAYSILHSAKLPFYVMITLLLLCLESDFRRRRCSGLPLTMVASQVYLPADRKLEWYHRPQPILPPRMTLRNQTHAPTPRLHTVSGWHLASAFKVSVPLCVRLLRLASHSDGSSSGGPLLTNTKARPDISLPSHSAIILS